MFVDLELKQVTFILRVASAITMLLPLQRPDLFRQFMTVRSLILTNILFIAAIVDPLIVYVKLAVER